MKFLLVIAMFALAGLSSTSAAAIDADSMEGFKENLQRMLSDITQQIKETANADESMDVEEFIRENTVDADASIVDENNEVFADDELSVVEEDEFTENVQSGIRCSWRGLSGRCCQGVRIVRIRLNICLTATILPPTGLRAALSFNGHTIWRRTIASRHNYNVCTRKGKLRLCILIYNVGVSRHSATACLRLTGRFHFIKFRKTLGCFSRRFASNEELTEGRAPVLLTSKQEHTKDSFLKPEKHTDDVLRFEH